MSDEIDKIAGEWRKKQQNPASAEPLIMPADLGGLKAGWKTSEFWITLGSQALALLVIFGVITSGDSQFIGEQIGKVVGAVFALVGVFWQTKSYVEGRSSLKLNDQDKRTELLRSR